MQTFTDRIDSLPPHLAERVHPLADGPSDGSGEFVLYWMHHAARGHENPALDVALAAAEQLGVPVLVYQGLGGPHRFNSDRHHTFIMEGACDAAAECAERGVRHVFHLATDPAERSPLTALAERAALVVAEDFPAPPFPAWTRRLADRAGRPVWLVDAACVVPMRTVAGVHERAFRFRNKAWKPFKARVDRDWGDHPNNTPDASAIEVGFEPIDWDKADISDLFARCAIDHTVGPVPHTPGGARAGYDRWNAFRDGALRSYAKRRNNAAVDGVSRLSPYLHHGMISPLRIAREAWRAGGAAKDSGPEKFIDELFVWRELSHHFALHNEGVLESLDVLPEWARDTLEKHARDERERVFSWETLARGRTGDRLWAAAQRSLLVHGELHNNVRMTWGKALVGWTASPGQALRRLIDLNHRYALDGNDPNSYAGLLWCLGALDRPFSPEQPVLGEVRPRPTEQHASRLDLERYEARTGRPARSRRERVLVIGAGVAGLACARTLADHGLDVAVFDKGRGPGGRTARRRDGAYRFDHAAQYFTARDERFRRRVRSWVADGDCAEWTGRIVALAADGSVVEEKGGHRYVGVPGMNQINRRLAEGVEVSFGRRVEEIAGEPGAWRVRTEDGDDAGPFDLVLVTAPAPQAAELLAGPAAGFAERARGAEMLPCLTAMVAFDRPLEAPFDGAFVAPGSPLAWISRDSSKPGRDAGAGDQWVLHATPEHSAGFLEEDKPAIAERLFAAFRDLLGDAVPAQPVHLSGHRWRHARVQAPADASPGPSGCLFDGSTGIGAAGDWCAGERVEDAFLSGCALAGRVLGRPDPDADHTRAPEPEASAGLFAPDASGR